MAPICPMMEYTGLWQSFLMFAPGRQQNVYLDAIVKLDTGERILWAFPRLEKFGILERLSLERYRKFGHDYVVNDEHKVLWPGFARYIAHRVQKSTNKKPVSVELFSHTAEIPAPEGDRLPPPNEKYKKRLLYSHIVQAEDLL